MNGLNTLCELMNGLYTLCELINCLYTLCELMNGLYTLCELMNGLPHFGEVPWAEVPLHPVEADPSAQAHLPTNK